MSASTPAEFLPDALGAVRCFVCEHPGGFVPGCRHPGPEEMFQFGIRDDDIKLYLHRRCLEGPHGPILDVLYLRRVAEVLFDKEGRNIWW